MNCARCNKEIPDAASACPSCGFSFDDATRQLEPTSSRSNKPGIKESTSAPSFASIDDARFVPGAIVAERYRIVGLLGRAGQPLFRGKLLED